MDRERKRSLLLSRRTTNRVLFQVLGKPFKGVDPWILHLPGENPVDRAAVDTRMTRCSTPLPAPLAQAANHECSEVIHADIVPHKSGRVNAVMRQNLSYIRGMPKNRAKGLIESVVGENLETLMLANPALSTERAVGRLAKMNPSTVGRIKAGTHSCSLDTLAKLAKLFGLQPWMMLIPELDPKNPPIRPIKLSEVQTYEKIDEAFASLRPDPVGVRHTAAARSKA